jgi:hypothetical protein
MSKVVLNATEYKDYKNEAECFGHSDKDVGYCADAECCQAKECPVATKCELICNGAEVVLEGNEPETKPEVKAETKVVEDSPKYTREIVKDIVVTVCAEKGLVPEVTPAATRDKIFIGEDDVFTVTNRALKINRLENGKILGINATLWKLDNKAITVEYDNSIDFAQVVNNALDGLYIQSLPKTEKVVEKKDLFDGAEDKPTATKVSAKDKPVSNSEIVVDKNVVNALEPGDYIAKDEVITGEVVKSMQIIQYSNGYNEIRIISRAKVEDLLNSVKGIIG